MAKQWWKASVKTEYANADLVIPDSIDKALELGDTLMQPARIRVWVNRKNPQILYREFL